MSENYKQTNWWGFLDEVMRELVEQSRRMLAREQLRPEGYKDYSFILFPAAKAYEGFLKKLFLEMRLINYQQYAGEHFRIGRALSPTLPKRYRSGWVYGKLAVACGGDGLPMKMWEVWKRARNRVFHYFPGFTNSITLEEAEQLLKEIEGMMEEALAGCRV